MDHATIVGVDSRVYSAQAEDAMTHFVLEFTRECILLNSWFHSLPWGKRVFPRVQTNLLAIIFDTLVYAEHTTGQSKLAIIYHGVVRDPSEYNREFTRPWRYVQPGAFCA